MITIHKFKLDITDVQEIMMPNGAGILCVKEQDGAPHIWAIIDTAQPRKFRTFRTYGTGHEMDDSVGHYIGTYQIKNLPGGEFVGHVFDITPLD